MKKQTVFEVYGSVGGQEYLLGIIMCECNAGIFATKMAEVYKDIRIKRSTMNRKEW